MPVTAADLGIEPVTIFRTGADRYRNIEPREDSTARIRSRLPVFAGWKERMSGVRSRWMRMLMPEFVLIMTMIYGSPAIAVVDHLERESCERIGKAWLSSAPRFTLGSAYYTCEERLGRLSAAEGRK